MIREERDHMWWINVAHHPEVSSRVGHISLHDMTTIIAHPNVVPLAAKHGGFLFTALDVVNRRVFELHTLFTPEGWGREAYTAGREALVRLFADTALLIITSEMKDNDKSRPPRSFGFVALGDFAPTALGLARTWMLTCEAWHASPAGRKSCH